MTATASRNLLSSEFRRERLCVVLGRNFLPLRRLLTRDKFRHFTLELWISLVLVAESCSCMEWMECIVLPMLSPRLTAIET